MDKNHLFLSTKLIDKTNVAIALTKEEIKGVPSSNIINRKLDKYFGYDYLNNMYNYLWKIK